MKDYITVPEDLIKITKYEVLDKLPNPFIFNDGTPLKTKEDWQKRKQEILSVLQFRNVLQTTWQKQQFQ